MPRRTQIVLHVTNPHGEPGIHDVQIWIDAQGKHKEHRAIGRIPIEKITVIKIALGAGDRDRVRRLVDGVIIALGQHRLLPSLAQITGSRSGQRHLSPQFCSCRSPGPLSMASAGATSTMPEHSGISSIMQKSLLPGSRTLPDLCNATTDESARRNISPGWNLARDQALSPAARRLNLR